MNHDYSFGDGGGVYDEEEKGKNQHAVDGKHVFEETDFIGIDVIGKNLKAIRAGEISLGSITEGVDESIRDGEFHFTSSDSPLCMGKAAPYVGLKNVLELALEQASKGKGKERHANGRPFEQQPIMTIGRMVGAGYALGQAMKKAQESQTLLKIKGKDAAKSEILGAINYLAAAYLLYDEGE